ncbi:hypothetical protein [Chelatococcus asaccharovorans]|uniref:Uncharacterized protein n=1 Tax=Chelatococcus asaccharovorans TaxID=28210 RepID=A0A2V3UQV5_9HYPH|nr:hypothetical protein [Chelatococcus asaccharovorans]MBS7706930.1 hypothetical protein [Chelatococcus asaccharovorans]PXW63109.1 hypothetical protein C7450_10224 [Chelatococcus asaccharovorans]
MTDSHADLPRITLYEYDLGATPVDLAAGPYRFAYVETGALRVEDASGARTCAADDGLFLTGPAQLSGNGRIWVYEVDPTGAAFKWHRSIILSHPLAVAFDGPWLMRADRIESPSGAATPRHGHRGPGIRRLVYGRLLAEVGDHFARIAAGQAWFETGHDPVIGTNISDGNSAFVRVMVLPAELEGGKSSFMPTTPADAGKPRAVTNRLFGECLIPRS